MVKAATASGLALLALAVSAPAFAQDEAARKVATEVAARVPLEKATTGAPYSAETVVEGIQVLADGNRIVRKNKGRVYRDSAGRTRREESGLPVSVMTPNGTLNSVTRTSISIVDPVAGFSYSLDPERKIAWRTPIGTSAAILNKVEAATAEDQLKLERMKREMATTEAAKEGRALEEQKMAEEKKRAAAAAGPGGRGGWVAPEGGEPRMRGYAFIPPGPLERKTIEGVLVEGRKTTTVIPAGQVGNEQPLTIVSEEWRSPDLDVLVMTSHSDPRTGESTYRLTDIVRAEPDASLFMVPPDYEIRESGVRRMVEAKK